MTMQATKEQAIAIDTARLGQSYKIIAYAGTGKTTTLQMISQAMPERRGLYLAFNKAIATHAQQRFSQRVDCRTFHSLAYRNVPREITDKLRLPRLSPNHLAQDFKLEPVMVRRLMGSSYEKYVMMPSRLGSIIANAVNHFCTTASQYPAPRHIVLPDWIHPNDADELQKKLYPHLERRWLDSINPQHQAGIGHDIYLKLWALSEPNIPTDYILFDEAQDADPIMLGILLKQKNAQIIYVGDAHQQIYEWRGAVNAMQRLPLLENRLTTSFRFGDEIAETANYFLSALKERVPLQGYSEIPSRVVNKPHTKMRDAILCRTNARAMELLISGLAHGDKVSLQADQSRLSRFIDAATALKQGKKVTDVPELAWFNSWSDVHEYCETNDGSDIKPLVKLVDDHGTSPLKKALDKLTPIAQADYVISTAHKAKGLEWNRVHIEDDYQFKLNKLDHKISPEELRLLYVACTRAKLSLNIHHIYDLVQQLKKDYKPLKSDQLQSREI